MSTISPPYLTKDKHDPWTLTIKEGERIRVERFEHEEAALTRRAQLTSEANGNGKEER